MEYAIQRRSIYLAPPEANELPWLFDQFDTPEVYEMFGFHRPSKTRIMRAYRGGNLVVGIIHRVKDRKRIGFACVFPPAGSIEFWEFAYAIPDPLDRDAFSALNTCDAMAHYMLEHLRVPMVGWRTREDNRAADAVVRRLGYEAGDTNFVDGHNYTFYRMDLPLWQKRKARLIRGEEAHPSGTGEAFVTLATHPYTPVT